MKLVATIDVRINSELPENKKAVQGVDWLVRNLNNKKLLVPFSILDQEQELNIAVVVHGETFKKLLILSIVPLMISNMSDEVFDDNFPRELIERRLLLTEFEIRVNDIFIALQIANPGEFDFLNISFFMDGMKMDSVYHDRLFTPFAVLNSKENVSFNLQALQ